ncbi:spore germination protein [Desertibacillus haloalkaliphilus]|uniref:spore germination protein n=1 Tax=Desertibacillus haloalkaliphilus TaxID=1328930 RepID=UPI001C2656DE|nr:spore germination protein [Desertibacillus haloalkaliphilus]MBU8906372.1 spore germination protein [Desertibacillus haloalkaliphilus]
MTFFTHMNNILGIRINQTSNNASMNFGHAVHKGHQANSKLNVGYGQPGDANFSPLQFNNANLTNDPDAVDQAQAQV